MAKKRQDGAKEMTLTKPGTPVEGVPGAGDVIWDYIVDTEGLLRPEDKGYEDVKDPLWVGFQLGFGANRTKKKDKDVSGWDFLSDESGIRPGEYVKPRGSILINLDQLGVSDKTVLPPLAVWKMGNWLDEWLWLQPEEELQELPFDVRDAVKKVDWNKMKGKVPETLYCFYVVTGEGTPGNHRWRVYRLPEEECIASGTPRHPLMWPSELKKPSSGWSSGSSWASKTTTTPAKKTPALPAGLRYRCVGCGHWFKQDDLSGHAQVCPATNEDKTSDWAIMCVAECGCRTLDQASTCKEGFPRPKPEKPTATASESGGGGGSDEGAPTSA